jgi:peptidoglycan hydrolase-like protein with peptidoglycan-binding domain
MEKLKFALFSIVTLVLLGLFGYWSIVTIQSGDEHIEDQKVKTLQKENEDLKTQVKKLTSELGVLKAQLEPAPVVTPEMDSIVVYKHQDLINEIQELADSNISLKLKSRGAGVGTVQKFLNVYNNTSSKVDNDYGEGTKTRVAAFQKDMGLSADGEAGQSTFLKMIEWLKNQG